jgi:hypothetical protein
MNQSFLVTNVEKKPAINTADFFQQRGENGFKERADKVWAKVAKRKPLPEGDWTPA